MDLLTEINWYMVADINLYTLLVEGVRVILLGYAFYVLGYIGNLWRGRESKRASMVIVGIIAVIVYLAWAVIHNGITVFELDDFLRLATLDVAIFAILRGSKILAQFEAECNRRVGTCPVCGHNKEL